MIISASKLADIKTVRAGGIPYTISNGVLYFLLARDGISKELGDFGGGVRKNELSLMAGFREFREETRGIFYGYESANDIAISLAVKDPEDKMAVIFIPVSNGWLEDAPKLFKEISSSKRKFNEISDIVWVNESSFKDLIRGSGRRGMDVMWSKVRRFFNPIYNNEDFFDGLKKVAIASLS
jgi:hypothetical protein